MLVVSLVLLGLKLNAAGKDNPNAVYLGLGSNIAPQVNLPKAIALLRKSVRILALSNVWESPPVSGPGPNFLNAAALIHTRLSAEELRDQVLRPIEARLGRVRTPDPNAPRTIDLDILIYDGQVIEADLWHQAHLCIPLAEINSDYTHPETGEPISTIADRLARSTPIHPHPLLLNQEQSSHNGI
ncbi:MAG TPA: 2-amino-4-hydroxy-6-hydroxymethyldihydropteridine diphosphokinase [Anaerolineales bacterium]|nr:2-amino-4-hydroxy-6-hydroxymethyldihydropteridine diphosphokinase [Anaerolineales bacterium]